MPIGKTGTDLQFGRAHPDDRRDPPPAPVVRATSSRHIGVADDCQPATVGMHHVGDGGVEFGEQVQLRGGERLGQRSGWTIPASRYRTSRLPTCRQ